MSKLLLAATVLFGLAGSAAASETHFARPPSVRVDPSAEPSLGIIAPPRSLDRATVRSALAKARATNLAAFRAYQMKGVFPSNTFKPDKLNVWRDADGHLCAAATIINNAGQQDLVAKVAEQNNFIRLADVKQGPLMDWILTSGLTQDEIAAIQEPFNPVYDEPRPEPAKPVLVDATLRKAEDARLRAKYRAVEAMIMKSTSKSLDLATDRLMKHPSLAWQLVDRQST
jgi:hypothetical protein